MIKISDVRNNVSQVDLRLWDEALGIPQQDRVALCRGVYHAPGGQHGAPNGGIETRTLIREIGRAVERQVNRDQNL